MLRPAQRNAGYTALLYQDLLRASSEALAPVLPIVLYDGAEEWTAAMDVAGLSVPPGAHLAPCQPSQRYVLPMCVAILAPCRRGAIGWRR